MISLLKKLWKDTSGNILVMAAAAMPVVIGSAGLATDTIQWVLLKRQLQRTADSAAIAGAFERQNLDEISTPALVRVAVDLDLAVNNNTGLSFLSGYPQVDADDPPRTIGNVENTAIVTVTLAVQKALPFSSLFLRNAPVIEVSATAASLPGSDDYCVVALGKTEKVGVDVIGNADLNLYNCGIMSNSSHTTNAINAGGSGTIRATVVAAKGQISRSARIIGAEYNPSTSYFDDPFESLTPSTSAMKCTDVVLTGGSDDADPDRGIDEAILDPDGDGEIFNCFSGINVGSGTNLQLDDGRTYYVNGGDVNIQGTISCTDCTIVLTNADPASSDIGNFNSNAQANIEIKAPTADGAEYRYIAIMQDRRAPANDDDTIQSSENKINGGSGTGIQGIVYFPNQSVVYLGNSNTSADQCTKLMAKRVGFSGNNTTSVNAAVCSGLIPDWSTGRVIRLIA